jgi:hypothetical protein
MRLIKYLYTFYILLLLTFNIKIKSIWILIFILLGFISFIIFVYSIENIGSDILTYKYTDMSTWFWLLNSIIFFTISIFMLLIEVWKDIKENL